MLAQLILLKQPSKKLFNSANILCVPFLRECLYNPAWLNSDKQHPNQSGVNTLAISIANVLRGNRLKQELTYNYELTAPAEYTCTGGLTHYLGEKGNYIFGNINITGELTTPYKVVNITLDYSHFNQTYFGTCQCRVGVNDNFTYVPAYVKVEGEVLAVIIPVSSTVTTIANVQIMLNGYTQITN